MGRRTTELVALGSAVMVALVVLATASAATRSAGMVRVEDLGSGAGEVWVMLPETPPKCMIVFLHAGGDLSPSRYTSWLGHLSLGDKCAVLFPRYELRASDSPASDQAALRRAIRSGLGYYLGTTYGLAKNPATPNPRWYAIGVGQGATLALAYAARAESWGLQTPRAIDAVFPVVPSSAELPAAPLPASVHVFVQTGDRPVTATGGAAVWKYLTLSHDARRSRAVVHSSKALPATLSAPLLTTAAAETAFWVPADEMIERR